MMDISNKRRDLGLMGSRRFGQDAVTFMFA
jgi:hypothetical protein